MKLKSAVLLITLSLPLAGCGNKGPLVLPQAPVSVDAPVPVAPPVNEVPAQPVPADATTPPPATPPATPPEPTPQDGNG